MNTFTPPDAAQPRPDHASLQQAAEWFATFDGRRPDGQDAAPADRAAWQRWLEQDPRHRAAWAHVEAVSADFGRLSGSGRATARGVIRQPLLNPARRRALGGLGAVAVLGAGSWWLTRPAWPEADATLARARTGLGEVRVLALADGAQAWLNAHTAVVVENTPALRLLRLERGEVFIASHHGGDAAARRPLVVETPQGRVQALGTRFSVRATGDGQTQVAVFDGAVRLTPRAPAAGAQPASTLQAGEQASFDAEQVAAAGPSRPAREAWVRGTLIAENMRLDEFLQELSQHRRGHLGCDPAVAGLRIDGVFPLADTDAVLRMLAETLPVRVAQTTPWWVDVGPR
ncbi:MAG: FecR domain-containing protein [Pseudorhodoferax sp.]